MSKVALLLRSACVAMLLAVDEDPGQVEPGQVDTGTRAARGLERVDHPRSGVEDGDARVSHLAGDVDGDGPGSSS